MKLCVLAVGKLKDPGLRELCHDYQSRIRRHAEISEVELRDDRALLKSLPKSGRLVALEVGGETLSSTRFSERLLEWTDGGGGTVSFVVGGAEGNPTQVRQRADACLSLSAMTLPHRLARVLLFEQLYRALSIWKGEPYAREG